MLERWRQIERDRETRMCKKVKKRETKSAWKKERERKRKIEKERERESER